MLTDIEKQKLIEERDRLKARLDAIGEDYRRGLDADSGERAVQLENADTLSEIQRVTAEELARVEAYWQADPNQWYCETAIDTAIYKSIQKETIP